MFITKKELKARIDEAVDKALNEERSIRWQDDRAQRPSEETQRHFREYERRLDALEKATGLREEKHGCPYAPNTYGWR